MKKFLYLFLTLIIFTTAAYADITKTKLSNGQTIIVKEVKTNPIVMIDTWVKTGSIDENDKNNGVAHFLEHLFFKGSENYPVGEFDTILESKGASTNAATSKDYTHFHILIPSKDFETAIKLHADMLTKPSIPVDELQKERQVVIREIERKNDNPSRILLKHFNESLYKVHPYKREVIGTKDIIANISRDEIVDFYKKHYSPQNMITVVVGDVDAKNANALISKYFSDGLSKQKPLKRNYKMDKAPSKQISVSSKEDVNTSYMMIGYKCGQKVNDKDSYALDLLSVIMGGGKSSVLYKEIKDKQQLAQGISANHSSYAEDSVYYVYADLYEQNIEKVKEEVFDTIEKFKTTPVSEEELTKAKKMLERNTLYERESVSNIASEIGYSTLLTGDWNFYNNYLKEVKKVSAKDIQKVATKYLNSKHAIISVITPKNSNIQEQPKITCVDEEEYISNITPDMYYKPKNHKYVSVESSCEKKKYVLDNGATLLTDLHKNNEIIAVTINVKGGNYTDKIKGLSTVLSDVITEGTERYPKEVFAKITDENGIKIGASANTEYFTLQMQCTKSDLPLAIDLLNQVVNKATLKDEEIEKSKNEIVYGIKQSRDNAMNVAFEEASAILWKDTPYDKTGKLLEKTIPAIKVSDVKEKYSNIFSPQNMVIAVSGDVSEQELVDLFGDIFKNNNSSKIDYSNYKNLFKPITENQVVVKNQGKESAWLVLSWKTDGLRDKKERVTLRVINAILGSGMSSRLFTEVRAQKGLAYAVASTVPSNVNQGTFTIYIGTDPNKVNDAEKAIMEEVSRLMKEFVTSKELSDAKNKLKGEAILSQELNIEKTNSMAVSETVGNGYDYYYDNFNQLVDSVTVSDVIEVANKYLSKPYVLSKVLPKK